MEQQLTPALVLSDDEVVALAAAYGLAWHGPLRTVDVSQRDQMVAALERGLRTLRRRAPGGGVPTVPAVVDSPLVADLVRAACNPPVVTAYVARLSAPDVLAGAALLVFPLLDDAYVVELVSGVGRHEISVASRETVRDLLVTVARAELGRQPGPDGSDDDRVTVLAGGGAGGLAFVVRPGAFAPAQLDPALLELGPELAAIDEAAVRALVPEGSVAPPGGHVV